MDPTNQPPVPQTTATPPVMDVRPPEAPAVEPAPALEPIAPPVERTPSKKATKPARAPKQRSNNVDLAVAATIIIVLGVAALFVYAYLQSQP